MGKRICDMTPEERREAGRKGGLKSVEARRKKKAMKEALDVILSMPLKSGRHNDVEDIKNFAALKGKNINVQEAMMIAQVQKALKGDTQAAQFIRDTIGEKAPDSVELGGSVVVIQDDVEDDPEDDVEE